MRSVVSSYLGQVVASDSKRGYLSSIVGSCLYLIKGSDRNLYGCRCAVATREKKRSLVHGTSGLFTLHTFLKEVVYCLQLNTGGGSDDNLKVDF